MYKIKRHILRHVLQSNKLGGVIMTNNNKLKIIIAVLFTFIVILIGMLIYVVYNKLDKNEDSAASSMPVQTTASTTSASASTQQSATESSPAAETLDLNLYVYDADNYEKPKEIKTVTIDKKLYQDDITSAINKVLESTGLKINKATVNKNFIIIDLPKEVSAKFNEGSAGGITRTNILAMTILNLPDIDTMEVTVDGASGVVGDHFSFNGIFIKTPNGYELKQTK